MALPNPFFRGPTVKTTPLRLRAPREDGAVLAQPEISHCPEIIQDNRRCLATAELTIADTKLSQLRELARRETLDASRHYLESTGQSLPKSSNIDAPWIATGHQPEIYHPGVWIKNFAAAALAQKSNGIGLHVLIDNDTMKKSSIAVPAGSPEAPVLAHIPFDRWESEIPYEERSVLDDSVFASFANRVTEQVSRYQWTPLVQEYWKSVVAAGHRTRNVGQRLGIGRRELEIGMGCSNWEVPLSRLTTTESFRLLVAEILLRAQDFAFRHNEALDEYRKLNKIRSKNHPVPALVEGALGVEVPLWAWSADDPNRRHVFVRQDETSLTLNTAQGTVATLPLGKTLNAHDVAARLTDALGSWKLRPRALLTTIYLRLFVADLFIHGIGGGKYDELTDQIILRFFGIVPPAFAILTATALLPSTHVRGNGRHLAELARKERDLYWNPDRYITEPLRDQDPIAGWIEEKYSLYEEVPTHRQARREQFTAYRQINTQLRKYLGRQPDLVHEEHQALANAVSSHALLDSREFAFCLHSREALEKLVAQVR